MISDAMSNDPRAFASLTSEVAFKIADSQAEWEAAFQLVYRCYLRTGRIRANAIGLRVTPFQLLPSTVVFVGKLHDEVVSTVSLVGDGELGIPMETTYSRMVADRRARGYHLAEITSLADRKTDLRRFLPDFCRMLQLLVQFARKQGIDQIMMTADPKQASFYKRYLGFEPLGRPQGVAVERRDASVALCMDFQRVEKQRPRFYHTIFAGDLDIRLLQAAPMPESVRQYFQPRIDRSPSSKTRETAWTI